VTDTSALERPAGISDLRSLGILGGTFNPPHVGHLAVARRAREQLGLDLVLLMPAGVPPHKPAGQDPGAGHRLRMCQLAAEGVEGVSVCELEIDRDGPSYTVDTLDAIHASHPGVELTLIVGADTANTLGSWREPARLLSLTRLAVAARSGSDREAVLDTVASIAEGAGGDRDGARERVEFLEMGAVDVSSSQVRELAGSHASLQKQVGGAVAGYIAEHDLYAAAVASR
jgi:nicotinate-nucleotide adenylyltransferase